MVHISFYLMIFIMISGCFGEVSIGKDRKGLPTDETLMGMLAVQLTIVENLESSLPASGSIPGPIQPGPFTGGKLGRGTFTNTSGDATYPADYTYEIENWNFTIEDWWQEVDFGFTGIKTGSGTASIRWHERDGYTSPPAVHYTFGDFTALSYRITLKGDFLTTTNKKDVPVYIDASILCETGPNKDVLSAYSKQSTEVCNYKGTIEQGDIHYTFDQNLYDILISIF